MSIPAQQRSGRGRRIAALHDDERRGADPALTRKAAVDTAIEHHLVSKYTSLVAVDKTPARAADDPLAREQVPNLLPYGQSMNAIFGFPATATDAAVLQRRGLALLLAALLLLGAGTPAAECKPCAAGLGPGAAGSWPACFASDSGSSAKVPTFPPRRGWRRS